MIKVSKDL